MIGLDPHPYKLPQLVHMAEGRMKDEWNRFSSFMALMANIHCGSKKKTFSQNEFNPFAKGSRTVKKVRTYQATDEILDKMEKFLTGAPLSEIKL